MRKGIIILFLLLCVGSVFAQRKNSKKVEEIPVLYDSLPLLTTTLNKLEETEKILLKKGFSKTDNSLLNFRKSIVSFFENNDSKEDLLNVFIKQILTFSEKNTGLNTKNMIRSVYALLSEKKLIASNTRAFWLIESGNIKWNPSDFPSFNICSAKIICNYSNTEMIISDVDAIFHPGYDVLVGETGTISWKNGFLNSEHIPQASIFNYKINLKNNRYTAEAILNFQPYMSFVSGKIVHQAESPNAKKSVYPIFRSNNSNIDFSDDPKSYSLKGALELTGSNIGIVGDSIKFAQMKVVGKDSSNILILSDRFLINERVVISEDAVFSIKIFSDSIIHQNKQILFDKANKKLSVLESPNKISKAPFVNTYNNIQMFLSRMDFDIDSTTIDIQSDDAQKTLFVSRLYYEKDIFNYFQGISTVNPLVPLAELQSKIGEKPVSLSLIRKTVMYPTEETALNLVLDLSFFGYANYISKNKTVILYPSIVHIVNSARKLIDYDAIAFNISNKKASGKIDLKTGNLNVTGLESISLSADGNIILFPDENGLNLKKGLDFNVSGHFKLGLYNLLGKDHYFNYQNYMIDLKGDQQMKFIVPSFQADQDGKYDAKVILNSIDSLRGSVFLNLPNNKSGKVYRPEYPKIQTNNFSYLFYSSENANTDRYSKTDLFVKLYPFEIDSLLVRNTRNLMLKGIVTSDNIFDDFDVNLTVQKDYSFGFEEVDFSKGEKLYDRANFFGILTLNSEGLSGKGYFEYCSGKFYSGKMRFYKDALETVVDSMRISKTKTETETENFDVPNISGFQGLLKWNTITDTIKVETLSAPISVFDNGSKLKGNLFISTKGIKASGVLNMNLAEIKSDDIRLKSDSLISPKMDVHFKQAANAKAKVIAGNIHGWINVESLEGSFKHNRRSFPSEIDAIRYRVYMPYLDWDMTKNEMTFTSDLEQTDKLLSFSKSQDSLLFKANKAIYSLEKDTMEVFGVEDLLVADSHIFPKDNKLGITSAGRIDSLKNASIVVGKSNIEHNLTEANLTIQSAKKYKGNAVYLFENNEGEVKNINFKQISTNERGFTVAGAKITKEENFNLTPYLKFIGDIKLEGSKADLNFSGVLTPAVGNCPDIKLGGMFINMPVGSSTTAFYTQENEADSKKRKKKVVNKNDTFTGINLGSKGEMKAHLLNLDTISRRTRFIENKGAFSYDSELSAYVVTKTPKYTLRDEFIYYPDECKIISRGEIKFYDPSNTLDIKILGRVEQNLNTGEIKIDQASVTIKFPTQALDEMFTYFSRSLKNQALEEIDLESNSLRFTYHYLEPLTNPDYYFNPMMAFTAPQKRSIVISGIDFSQDTQTRTFTSKNQNLDLAMMSGEYTGKKVEAKVEWTRNQRTGDVIKICFYDANDKFYYLKYNNGLFEIYSSEGRFSELYRYIKKSQMKYRFPNKNLFQIKDAAFQPKDIFIPKRLQSQQASYEQETETEVEVEAEVEPKQEQIQPQ